MTDNSTQRQHVHEWLKRNGIRYLEIIHPPVPTATEAAVYWKGYECTFCKNLFFRDHRGKQHYLALVEHHKDLNIRDLELRIRRGKLSLASGWRLEKYLGVQAGSVSPLGLINDTENHVILLIDKALENSDCLGFHPNDNTSTLMIPGEDFRMFLDICGNPYEYLELC
jgi:Ala-tRNA(Pro) deacylase